MGTGDFGERPVILSLFFVSEKFRKSALISATDEITFRAPPPASSATVRLRKKSVRKGPNASLWSISFTHHSAPVPLVGPLLVLPAGLYLPPPPTADQQRFETHPASLARPGSYHLFVYTGPVAVRSLRAGLPPHSSILRLVKRPELSPLFSSCRHRFPLVFQIRRCSFCVSVEFPIEPACKTNAWPAVSR